MENLRTAPHNARAENRQVWVSPTKLSDSDLVVHTHYLSFIKGSTRIMALYVILVAAADLGLRLEHALPVVWQSAQMLRAKVIQNLTPERRLVEAMSARHY